MNKLLASLNTSLGMILDNCDDLGIETVPVNKSVGRILADTVCVQNEQGEMINFGFEEGDVVEPVMHAILYNHGVKSVRVYRNPMIGLISYDRCAKKTEKIDIDKQTADTFRYLLSDTSKDLSVHCTYLGSMLDQAGVKSIDLKMATKLCDVLLVYSADGNDELKAIVELLSMAGADVIDEHLELQKDTDTCLAMLQGVPVVGVSGFSSSILTAFHVLAMPIVRELSGVRDPENPVIMSELVDDYDKHTEEAYMVEGRIVLNDGIVRFQPRQADDFRNMRDMRSINALCVMPEGKVVVKKGTLLDTVLIK